VPPRVRGRRGTLRLVTLTSDVGAAYAAQMKGAILRLNPALTLVDLTHELPRHAVAEAAFVLRAMARSFPAGCVHVAVVDPGVGGKRAPLAVRCADSSVLVGPDNGVLSPLADLLGRPRAYRLDPRALGSAPRVGTTFDGRDLFAPAAARIASGRPMSRLGTEAPFRQLRLPEPHRRRGLLSGAVVHVDHFGNLISNLPTAWLPGAVRSVSARVGQRSLRRLPRVTSYEALGRGRFGLLGSSFGTLEVSVAEGSAAARLRSSVGLPVELRWAAERAGAAARVNRTLNLPRRRR
jgi:S-adenosylmethionine hydrolase